MPRLSFHVLIGLLLVAALGRPAGAQEAPEARRYALLIGGLGGQPAYTEAFRTYLFETRRALIERFGLPESHVTVLAEPRLQDEPFVEDVSSAEVIRARFEALAARVTPADEVFVWLFGHGSADAGGARLNIPRRDLADADYAALVEALPAERIVFINTAPASAPFIEHLSAPGRIVITATRTPSQRNETRFPQYLVEALTTPAADLDRDGALSVREAFVYAAEATDRSFREANTLPTEDALLDDDGDGVGHRVGELAESPDGHLAAVTYFGRREPALAAGGPAGEETAALLQERDALERAIADLKSRKARLDEDDYYAQLEALFVRLARLNERLDPQTP
ncbi:hypothetical protein AWN76_011030 [Rhodothermaceae bacterium RA]|nr:hypothetical protein AWN76_011030 [Rhodothermaceae bacterium RA]